MGSTMDGSRREAGAERDRPLAERSAAALARAFREGETTVEAHTEDVLALAHGIGEQVGAFAHVAADLSRRQARAADEALASDRRGERAGDGVRASGPLIGVPLPIKSLTHVAGLPFDGGSAALEGMITEATDGVAQDLLDAGTVTIGLTNAPEFGMPCYTEPAHRPPARTPWDLRRTAGGSSGGAAAAVAAGIVPIAHGSDGGGSVRIPAACCGVVGFKPSRGVVSPGPLGSEGPGLVTDGMLARTIADAALGMDAIAHVRAGDAFPRGRRRGFAEALADSERRPPAGLRIGLLTTPLNIDAPVHPAALRATERARALLEGLGHRVEHVGPAFTPEEWRAFMPLWSAGAASIPLPPEAEPQLMALTRWLRDTGRTHGAADYARALAGMQRVARQMGEAYAPFDLILTPSLAQPPAFPADLQLPDPAADFDAQCAFTPWTATWNMTGRAAISVPLHREEIDGVPLPFGVHLGAVRAGDDDLVLAVARQLEQRDPWPLITRPPRGAANGAAADAAAPGEAGETGRRDGRSSSDAEESDGRGA